MPSASKGLPGRAAAKMRRIIREERRLGMEIIELDGRKTYRPFADALRVAVMRTKGDKVQLARIAEALVRKAVRGDVQAIREIADRLDGKVATNLNVGSTDGTPTGIALIFVGSEDGKPIIEGEAEQETE